MKRYKNDVSYADQAIAAFQFFDACIDEIQQGGLAGTHRLCLFQLQLHNVNLKDNSKDSFKVGKLTRWHLTDLSAQLG